MSDSGQALDFLYNQQQESLSQGLISFDNPSTKEGGMPPWVIPPEGFLSFDEQGIIDTPAIGVIGAMLTFIVPDGYDGLIQRISHTYLGGGYVDGSGDLIWRINIDNRPAKNYSNMLVQLGDLNNPRPIAGIRVYSGQVITYTVEHVANPAWGQKMCATLAGYVYPRIGE